jgi:chromosome partitioning protein
MPLILIANPKGGAGKSTLSTNIAGLFARRGHQVMLGDIDVQQSARSWLDLRPAGLPAIRSWEMGEGKAARPPKGVTHVVIDTPAAVPMSVLSTLIRDADRVVIPVQPSPFDLGATGRFVEQLREVAPAAMRQGRIGLVGMRVDERTRSAEHFQRFCENIQMTPVTSLRDTQNYLHLAAHGLTLWDVGSSKVEKDLAQWQPLLAWLGEKSGDQK